MFLFGWPSLQCNCYSAFCCKRGQWNHVRIIYVFVFSLDIISELVLGFLDLSLSIYWLPLLAHALLKTGSTCGSHPKFVQTRFPKYRFWLFGQLLKLWSITICRFVSLLPRLITSYSYVLMISLEQNGWLLHKLAILFWWFH